MDDRRPVIAFFQAPPGYEIFRTHGGKLSNESSQCIGFVLREDQDGFTDASVNPVSPDGEIWHHYVIKSPDGRVALDDLYFDSVDALREYLITRQKEKLSRTLRNDAM